MCDGDFAESYTGRIHVEAPSASTATINCMLDYLYSDDYQFSVLDLESEDAETVLAEGDGELKKPDSFDVPEVDFKETACPGPYESQATKGRPSEQSIVKTECSAGATPLVDAAATDTSAKPLCIEDLPPTATSSMAPGATDHLSVGARKSHIAYKSNPSNCVKTLIQHVHVYAIADYYQINGLKTLAHDKFAEGLLAGDTQGLENVITEVSYL